MRQNSFIDNARIMSKGQIKLPKDVCDILGVRSGDTVSFITQGNGVQIVNSAAYAMQKFQREMAGQAEKANIKSEEDVADIITQIRMERKVPNEITVAALNEYEEMKSDPQKYPRYDNFESVLKETIQPENNNL